MLRLPGAAGSMPNLPHRPRFLGEERQSATSMPHEAHRRAGGPLHEPFLLDLVPLQSRQRVSRVAEAVSF